MTDMAQAVGWVETDAPELTGKSEAEIVSRLKQFEIPQVSPVVAWFDNLTAEELKSGIAPGQSQRVEGFTVIRIGNVVELRNSYGYAIFRRYLV